MVLGKGAGEGEGLRQMDYKVSFLLRSSKRSACTWKCTKEAEEIAAAATQTKGSLGPLLVLCNCLQRSRVHNT